MTKKDTDDGLGPPFTAAKFLCHRKDDPAKKPAFLRMYHQIPIAGTECLNSRIRASQAVPPIQHPELTALTTLKKMACKAVLDLLGYQEGQQGHNDIVPGGFVTYIVWDKVPGEPLSENYFWKQDRKVRDVIRKEFRRVYEQLVLCGIQPRIATSKKLIYDESTGKIHISGFRMAAPIDSNQKWSDRNYVMYKLAKRSLRPDWYLDSREWEF